MAYLIVLCTIYSGYSGEREREREREKTTCLFINVLIYLFAICKFGVSFFKDINAFIQQRYSKLTKIDNTDFYIVTKHTFKIMNAPFDYHSI